MGEVWTECFSVEITADLQQICAAEGQWLRRDRTRTCSASFLCMCYKEQQTTPHNFATQISFLSLDTHTSVTQHFLIKDFFTLWEEKNKPKNLDRIATRTLISSKTKMHLFPFPTLLFSAYWNAFVCFIIFQINLTLSIILCAPLTHFNTKQWPGPLVCWFGHFTVHRLSDYQNIAQKESLQASCAPLKKTSTWLSQLLSVSQKTFLRPAGFHLWSEWRPLFPSTTEKSLFFP